LDIASNSLVLNWQSNDNENSFNSLPRLIQISYNMIVVDK
jgi:hypothetical protein